MGRSRCVGVCVGGMGWTGEYWGRPRRAVRGHCHYSTVLFLFKTFPSFNHPDEKLPPAKCLPLQQLQQSRPPPQKSDDKEQRSGQEDSVAWLLPIQSSNNPQAAPGRGPPTRKFRSALRLLISAMSNLRRSTCAARAAHKACTASVHMHAAAYTCMQEHSAHALEHTASSSTVHYLDWIAHGQREPGLSATSADRAAHRQGWRAAGALMP